MNAVKYRKGFTLIELLIAVAIIGVVAAIAIPSYKQYVKRTNRAEPKALLAEIASKQEAFFADRRTYASALTQLGYPAATCYVGNTNGPGCGTSTTAYYSVAIAAGATATSYTATATLATGTTQSDDGCGNFSISSTGSKTVSGTETDCW